MPNQVINQIQYPGTDPSTNDFAYMCWITEGESNFAEYRPWVANAWVLNGGEAVSSFIEIARKKIE